MEEIRFPKALKSYCEFYKHHEQHEKRLFPIVQYHISLNIWGFLVYKIFTFIQEEIFSYTLSYKRDPISLWSSGAYFGKNLGKLILANLIASSFPLVATSLMN